MIQNRYETRLDEGEPPCTRDLYTNVNDSKSHEIVNEIRAREYVLGLRTSLFVASVETSHLSTTERSGLILMHARRS